MITLLPREQIKRLNELGQGMMLNAGKTVGDTGVAEVIVGRYYREAGQYIEKHFDATTEEGRQFLVWCASDALAELHNKGFPASELIVAVLYFCAHYSFGVIEQGWDATDYMPRGTFRYELGMQSDNSALLELHTPFYQAGSVRILRFTSSTDAIKHVSAGVH